MKMNRQSFKEKAEAAFKRANPGAITIRWHKAREVPRHTGEPYWTGKFEAIATGHQPKIMIATGDDSYVMVR